MYFIYKTTYMKPDIHVMVIMNHLVNRYSCPERINCLHFHSSN